MLRSTEFTASDLAADGTQLRGAGEVIGRTEWIAKSEFWPDRPDKSFSAKQAERALAKADRGEALGAREERFIRYAREYLAKFDEQDRQAAIAQSEAA